MSAAFRRSDREPARITHYGLAKAGNAVKDRIETVSNIEIAPDDSLLVVGLEGGGSPSYQYVYRAAAGFIGTMSLVLSSLV
jgi:hypothetical protein